MNPPPAFLNRRTAVRTENTSRIRWTSDRTGAGYTGWISDQSSHGVAFVTPTDRHPAPGERLDLTIGTADPVPRERTVRVVRVASYDRLFTLVGCRDEP